MKRAFASFFSGNLSSWNRSLLVAGLVSLSIVYQPVRLSAQVTNITSGKVIKWDQPPVLAAPTNVFYGWNEKSVYGAQVAADDWVCTTTNPVMKIRWWGSFIGWNSSDATPVLPFDFRIHFWTDQPSGPGNPFSHPQQAIWQIITTNYTWRCAGQDYDPRTGTFETCFLFEATLNPQDWFYQQPINGTNIYWLSIAADYPTGGAPFPFGWKTRPRDLSSPAPDSAVDIFNPAAPILGSIFVNGAPIAYAALTNKWDLAFELVTAGITTIPSSKWEQVPDLTPLGLDVNDTFPQQVPATQPPFLLADDFLCTSPGYITNVTIWGSWLNDVLPQNPAGGPPDANNVTFVLSFHDDIPASQSPTGYSMPGAIRRQFTFGPGSFIHSIRAANIQEGWLTPPGAYIPPPADTVCHQYDFPIGFNLDPFFQDGTPTSPKVFWLDVQAMPATGGNTNAIFGWKTCITNWNDAAVWANAVEAFGGPWNKLIYPPNHPKSGTNIDLAFRLNTSSTVVSTEFVKWSQPPVVAANPGNWYNGWNEPSVDGGGIWNNIPLTNIVADDWLCTNARPVTDIHWWGSFLGWVSNSLPSDPLMGFHFAIWTDVPTGPNAPFSHPGVVLWENRAFVGDPNLRIRWVGWDLDPRDPCLAGTESCFLFDYSLPGTNNWFFQQPGTNIYWLSISAMYPAGFVLQNPFGWKTRPHNPVPPDDAVRIFNPLGPALPPGTPFGFGEPIEFPVGTTNSWDMAFRLTSCQQAPLTNVVFTNIVVINNIPLSQRVVTIKWNNSLPGTVYQFQEVLVLTNHPVNPWTDVGSPIIGPVNTAVFTNTLDVEHYYRIRYPDLCP